MTRTFSEEEILKLKKVVDSFNKYPYFVGHLLGAKEQLNTPNDAKADSQRL
jgi:hypothetical protein